MDLGRQEQDTSQTMRFPDHVLICVSWLCSELCFCMQMMSSLRWSGCKSALAGCTPASPLQI